MAEKTKRVCLTQYLRDGDTRTKTKDFQLSLDDHELNLFICRQKGGPDVKENFEIVAEEGRNLSYLAIIRLSPSLVPYDPAKTIHPDTQNGFACLEALVSDVFVPLLGKGFDGRCAHDYRLKPTQPGSRQRSVLQLRPGEPFYIQNLSFTLVPEEERDHPAQVVSAGVIPTYDEYSQHVSQVTGGSQACLSPSPQKVHRMTSAIPETPAKSKITKSEPTPLVHQMAANAMHGKEDSQEWPESPEKRSVLNTLRDLDGDTDSEDGPDEPSSVPFELRSVHGVRSTHLPPTKSQILDLENGEHPISDITDPVMPNGSEHHLTISKLDDNDRQESTALQASGHPENSISSPSRPEPEGATEANPTKIRPLAPLTDPQPLPANDSQPKVSDDEDEPQRKKRRLSSHLAHQPAEESQDSLAGRSIEVAAQPSTPAVVQKFKAQGVPCGEHLMSQSSSRASKSTLRTPSSNNSMLESPMNSGEPASSLRSRRSTAREDSCELNVHKDGIRILFASSTSADTSAFRKFLLAQEVKIVQKCKDATCLCVGKGELKKTPKLILAVLMGIEIIREDWVTDSARQKKLQEISSYAVRDSQRELEWGIKIDEAIERGRQKTRVFQGCTVTFTPSAKKEFGKSLADFKEILNAAGAAKIDNVLPKKSPSELPSTIVIGTHTDAALPALKGWRCYTKDLVILSALRGKLCIDSDEFLIQEETKKIKETKGNMKRKC